MMYSPTKEDLSKIPRGGVFQVLLMSILLGSPSAYYYHPGNSTEGPNTNLIIYFYGGGACVDSNRDLLSHDN